MCRGNLGKLNFLVQKTRAKQAVYCLSLQHREQQQWQQRRGKKVKKEEVKKRGKKSARQTEILQAATAGTRKFTQPGAGCCYR